DTAHAAVTTAMRRTAQGPIFMRPTCAGGLSRQIASNVPPGAKRARAVTPAMTAPRAKKRLRAMRPGGRLRRRLEQPEGPDAEGAAHDDDERHADREPGILRRRAPLLYQLEDVHGGEEREDRAGDQQVGFQGMLPECAAIIAAASVA